MNIYSVTWKIKGGGAYIPDDPCVSSGGYYGDRIGIDIITAASATTAAEAVRSVRAGAVIHKPKLICSASKGKKSCPNAK